jgi:hypothetical protein
LFHVSSLDPFQVFPLLTLSIPVWAALVFIVVSAYVIAFLLRKNLADGLLLILFLGLLAFAFSYPGKRVYFSLYPSLVFLIMLGRVAQFCVETVRARRFGFGQYAAIAVVALTVTALAINSFAVPATYQSGFGDYDEMTQIMGYIGTNHASNSYVATTLAEIGYYVRLNNINVSLAYMKEPVAYNSEPPINQSLQTRVRGIYPIYWVISTASVQKLRPQFIVIPRIDYLTTSTTFRRFIAERYYEPLSTKLILVFQVRP